GPLLRGRLSRVWQRCVTSPADRGVARRVGEVFLRIGGNTSWATFLPEGMMVYQETFVQREQHRIYVREHPGAEPPIILMHGFPDNMHLYDRLVPHLTPPRRVVLFDFLGWGSSDKPAGYPYTTANQVGDIDAVITQLKLGPAVLVVHTRRVHRASTGRWTTPRAWRGLCC